MVAVSIVCPLRRRVTVATRVRPLSAAMGDRHLLRAPGTDARHRPGHGRGGPLPTRTADPAVSVQEQAPARWVPDVLPDSVSCGVLNGRSDRLSRRLVWLVLVVLFAGGWGQGLVTAAQFLAGPDPRDPHPSVSRVWSQGVEGFSQAALLVVAVVLAVRWAGVSRLLGCVCPAPEGTGLAR